MKIIGRKREQDLLRRLVTSNKSEFLVVYGRRRVGKTYLVKEYFKDDFAFYTTGVAGEPRAGMTEQLVHFSEALAHYGLNHAEPLRSWEEAFAALRQLLTDSPSPEKKVVFLDEMPWLDTPRSKFVTALEYFWNSFASSRDDILLIACGSAASWMAKKVLRNRGGLHNRVTMRLLIEPFSLAECEEFYTEAGLVMSRYQILEAYMILGGIPYYLSLLDSEKGLAENIDLLFFAPSALLEDEFNALYSSLFKNSATHQRVISALAEKKKGMDRKGISKATGLAEGGSLTRVLEDLVLSGFLRKYTAFSRKERGTIYQLIDPYTLFYFQFIAKNNDTHFWQKYQSTSGHASWSGYAFELVCLHHIEQIKKCVGASMVIANTWSWKSEKTKPGAQIDLVIDRSDGIIDLCEMKYLNADMSISTAYAKELRHKRAVFLAETATRKVLHTVLVTTYGLLQSAHSAEVQARVLMDDLFVS